MKRRHKFKLVTKGACVLVVLTSIASLALAIEDAECLKCHADPALKRNVSDGMKDCLFLDHKKFKLSVHGDFAVTCTDCHEGVKKLDPSVKGKKVPHSTDLPPVKCVACHSDEHDAFIKSDHYKIRRKGITLTCYSCHKYHQVKPLSGYSAPERNSAFCTKCHKPEDAHDWLPQKKRHFARVDCSVCHAPKVKRYVNLRIFDKTRNAFPTDKELLASLKTKKDEFMALADLDEDQKINAAELQAVFDILRKGGINPVLRGELLSELVPSVHEINADNAIRDCDKCHKPSAEYYQNMSLSLVSGDNTANRHAVSGDVLGSFGLLPDFYAMSATRADIVDRYGLLLILVTVSAVGLHFLVRLATVSKRRRKSLETSRPEQAGAVLIHSAATRLWHWMRSVSILALLITGAQIRYNDQLHFMSLSAAVVWHGIAAMLLIVAFVFWLAHSLIRGKIRDYIAHPRTFASGVRQAIYYMGGYFRGKPDPHQPTPEDKFDTLQKMTYGATMILMLPAHILTGLLLSDRAEYGQWVDMLGGAKTVAAAHAAMFFMVIAFLMVHLYMSTMGKTPLQHIRTMITGYRRD
jgi:thiosulfate reductase cytochrome b subunit